MICRFGKTTLWRQKRHKLSVQYLTNSGGFDIFAMFSGGQEHLEQVQRGGGEAFAHLGGAGLRLCIRDHLKLSYDYVSSGALRGDI